VIVAGAWLPPHTLLMRASRHHCVSLGLLALLVITIAARTSRADEIRLKDGKKLYGVIVAYEDNMFKVKTDFGYVLVEKDKIAQIIPSTPAEATPPKTNPAPATKPAVDAAPKVEPAVATSKTSPGETNPNAAASEASKREKTAAIVNKTYAHPELPAVASKTEEAPPAIKSATAAATKTALAAPAAPPPPPKEEAPANREEVQGNLYINHEFGFRMYKAPSWQTIEGAGQTLPNAIVAMGTSNESTLLVVGREKTKAPLESAAQSVEKRLQEVYDNYRLISQHKTVVGGQPAVEFRYRGMADSHDWSGTLVVVSRSGDIFTVLGMTFADTDLIQIQENVIARAIASLDFSAK